MLNLRSSANEVTRTPTSPARARAATDSVRILAAQGIRRCDAIPLSEAWGVYGIRHPSGGESVSQAASPRCPVEHMPSLDVIASRKLAAPSGSLAAHRKPHEAPRMITLSPPPAQRRGMAPAQRPVAPRQSSFAPSAASSSRSSRAGGRHLGGAHMSQSGSTTSRSSYASNTSWASHASTLSLRPGQLLPVFPPTSAPPSVLSFTQQQQERRRSTDRYAYEAARGTMPPRSAPARSLTFDQQRFAGDSPRSPVAYNFRNTLPCISSGNVLSSPPSIPRWRASSVAAPQRVEQRPGRAMSESAGPTRRATARLSDLHLPAALRFSPRLSLKEAFTRTMHPHKGDAKRRAQSLALEPPSCSDDGPYAICRVVAADEARKNSLASASNSRASSVRGSQSIVVPGPMSYAAVARAQRVPAVPPAQPPRSSIPQPHGQIMQFAPPRRAGGRCVMPEPLYNPHASGARQPQQLQSSASRTSSLPVRPGQPVQSQGRARDAAAVALGMPRQSACVPCSRPQPVQQQASRLQPPPQQQQQQQRASVSAAKLPQRSLAGQSAPAPAMRPRALAASGSALKIPQLPVAKASPAYVEPNSASARRRNAIEASAAASAAGLAARCAADERRRGNEAGPSRALTQQEVRRKRIAEQRLARQTSAATVMSSASRAPAQPYGQAAILARLMPQRAPSMAMTLTAASDATACGVAAPSAAVRPSPPSRSALTRSDSSRTDDEAGKLWRQLEHHLGVDLSCAETAALKGKQGGAGPAGRKANLDAALSAVQGALEASSAVAQPAAKQRAPASKPAVAASRLPARSNAAPRAAPGARAPAARALAATPSGPATPTATATRAPATRAAPPSRLPVLKPRAPPSRIPRPVSAAAAKAKPLGGPSSLRDSISSTSSGASSTPTDRRSSTDATESDESLPPTPRGGSPALAMAGQKAPRSSPHAAAAPADGPAEDSPVALALCALRSSTIRRHERALLDLTDFGSEHRTGRDYIGALPRARW